MPYKPNTIIYRKNYRPMPSVGRGPKLLDGQTGIPTYVGRQCVDDFGVPTDYLYGSPDRDHGGNLAPTHNDVLDNGLDIWPRVNCGTQPPNG